MNCICKEQIRYCGEFLGGRKFIISYVQIMKELVEVIMHSKLHYRRYVCKAMCGRLYKKMYNTGVSPAMSVREWEEEL